MKDCNAVVKHAIINNSRIVISPDSGMIFNHCSFYNCVLTVDAGNIKKHSEYGIFDKCVFEGYIDNRRQEI